jgi:hypothetical protein
MKGERGKKGEWGGDRRFVLKAARWRRAKGRGKGAGGHVRVEEGEGERGWHHGGRLGAAGNGPQQLGTGGAMPRDRGARGWLTGGPRPQCRVATPADRRARATWCRGGGSNGFDRFKNLNGSIGFKISPNFD